MQPLVALDIGSTKVACAIGLPHEREPGFELLGSSLVPSPTFPEAWLADLLMVSRTIEQALEAAAVRTDVDRALVAVSHPLLTSERVRVAVPLGDEPVTVRAHDLERLHASALDQALGIDREPLLVERLDCAGNGFEGVRDPRGLSATRLVGTVHVITIPMAARRALIQAVEGAGFEVSRITYTLPSVLASLEDGTTRQRRTLLIDVGGLMADLGLFVEGILHAARIVPWGGLKLAAAIAKELKVTMDQALTWSLEGTACRKPAVRALVEHHWATMLKPAIESLLQDVPRPDAALVTGRGALIDGFAEWAERATGIRTSVGRSARLAGAGDLARQVGVSPAIGLLELATQHPQRLSVRSPEFVTSLLDRTRTILTEYF
jgi:cell division protein FtsA